MCPIYLFHWILNTVPLDLSLPPKPCLLHHLSFFLPTKPCLHLGPRYSLFLLLFLPWHTEVLHGLSYLVLDCWWAAVSASCDCLCSGGACMVGGEVCSLMLCSCLQSVHSLWVFMGKVKPHKIWQQIQTVIISFDIIVFWRKNAAKQHQEENILVGMQQLSLQP